MLMLQLIDRDELFICQPGDSNRSRWRRIETGKAKIERREERNSGDSNGNIARETYIASYGG